MIKYFLSILMVFAIFSCDNDGVEAKSNTFEVTLDGKEFKAKGVSAYWTDFSDGSYNAYGIVDDVTIYVGFEPNIGVGQHSISDDVYVYVVYDNGEAYSSLVDGSSGTVNLVKKDATTLQGDFDVTVSNFNDENDKINLKSGSFNVAYR